MFSSKYCGMLITGPRFIIKYILVTGFLYDSEQVLHNSFLTHMTKSIHWIKGPILSYPFINQKCRLTPSIFWNATNTTFNIKGEKVVKIKTSHNGNNSVLPCYGTIQSLCDRIKLLSTCGAEKNAFIIKAQ